MNATQHVFVSGYLQILVYFIHMTPFIHSYYVPAYHQSSIQRYSNLNLKIQNSPHICHFCLIND